jgi:hypothetical protein
LQKEFFNFAPLKDPSNRREVTLTIEFTVTNEDFEDDDAPWWKSHQTAFFFAVKKA